MLVKVTLWNGREGLIAARTLKSGLAQALRDEGTSNVRHVQRASKEDVAWVQAMGGRVPSEQ